MTPKSMPHNEGISVLTIASVYDQIIIILSKSATELTDIKSPNLKDFWQQVISYQSPVALKTKTIMRQNKSCIKAALCNQNGINATNT